jgi:hypothetical protein
MNDFTLTLISLLLSWDAIFGCNVLLLGMQQNSYIKIKKNCIEISYMHCAAYNLIYEACCNQPICGDSIKLRETAMNSLSHVLTLDYQRSA